MIATFDPMPMDAWRQHIRHRMANTNEYSTRYSLAIDSAQQTPPDQWRLQAESNKQGSEGFLTGEIAERLSLEEQRLHDQLRHVYEHRIEKGVAREQARKDLPLSTYTEAYWKCDLHNLLHYLGLRMDKHAQFEIRQFANAIYKLIQPLFPNCCEAFEDYRLNAMTLSAMEITMLRGMPTRDTIIMKGMTKREQREFNAMLKRIGMQAIRLGRQWRKLAVAVIRAGSRERTKMSMTPPSRPAAERHQMRLPDHGGRSEQAFNLSRGMLVCHLRHDT